MITPAQSFCSPWNPANGFLCVWGWCPESRIGLVHGCERVGCCLFQIPVKRESFSYHYYQLVGDWITRLLLHIVYPQNIPLLKICTTSVLFSAAKMFCLPVHGLLWHALMVWPLRSNLACTLRLDGLRCGELSCTSKGNENHFWAGRMRQVFCTDMWTELFSCWPILQREETNATPLSSRSLLVNCSLSEVSTSCELAIAGCAIFSRRTCLKPVLVGLHLSLLERLLVSFAFFGEQLNYLTCLIGKQFSCVIATQSPRQARDLSCYNSGQFRSAARAFTWHQGIVALRIICFHCTGRICVTGCNVKWGVGGPDA